MRHDPIDPARSGGAERPAIDAAGAGIDAIMRDLDTLERRALATIVASEDEIRTLESGATDESPTDTARMLAMAVLADVVARERRTVEDIAAARARLLEGTFGTCEACGRMISLSRLHAVPTARHCVACQAQGERTEREPAA
jgi:RNA polymerase-binding transcription factor DksA